MTVPDEGWPPARRGRKNEEAKRPRERTGTDQRDATNAFDLLAEEGGPALPPGRTKRWRTRSEVSYSGIALAGFLLGGIVALFSGYEIVMASRTLGWSRTEGIVVQSFVPPAEAWADVVYEYSVAGTQYKGDRIGYGKVVTEQSARRLVERYSEGKRVTVYYDPDDPSYSVLEQGTSLGIYAFFALALMGIGIGYWARRRALAAERPPSPAAHQRNPIEDGHGRLE